MAFSFKDLNLSGVEASSAGATLKPGRHACKIVEASIKDTRQNGKMLELKFASVKEEGAIRGWINLHVPSSEQATRIGREQLKAVLVHGGHPNPDKPGDISSLKGLVVGVLVGADTYQDKDGNQREGSKVKGFFAPSEVGVVATTKAKSDDPMADLDDDIPFM